MEEIWKDVVGYEGIYKVSNTGSIRGEKRLLSKNNITIQGYNRLSLYKDKKIKSLLAHRLVAIAFIPNPLNKPFINHINGIKTDNRLENLEWCTAKENIQHARRTGLIVVTDKQREHARKIFLGKHGKDNIKCKKLIDKETGIIYDSVLIAANHFKIQRPNLIAMLKGRRINKTKLAYLEIN